MRLFGHPVHAMVIHFPVGLWPAHAFLHLFGARLPDGAAAVAGFWILAAGTSAGWLAAFLGAADLVEIAREKDFSRLKTGLVHAGLNGGVLLGFTALTFAEYSRYPSIHPGAGSMGFEFALLAILGVGNFFGGSLVWRRSGGSPV